MIPTSGRLGASYLAAGHCGRWYKDADSQVSVDSWQCGLWESRSCSSNDIAGLNICDGYDHGLVEKPHSCAAFTGMKLREVRDTTNHGHWFLYSEATELLDLKTRETQEKGEGRQPGICDLRPGGACSECGWVSWALLLA